MQSVDGIEILTTTDTNKRGRWEVREMQRWRESGSGDEAGSGIVVRGGVEVAVGEVGLAAFERDGCDGLHFSVSGKR